MSRQRPTLTLDPVVMKEINNSKVQYNDNDNKNIYSKEYNNLILETINSNIKNEKIKKIAIDILNNIVSQESDKNEEIFNIKDYIIKIFDPKKNIHFAREFDLNKHLTPNGKHPEKLRHYTAILERDDNIIKVFNYQCSHYADFMIILEIAFHLYSSSITERCKYETPNIKNYGRFKLSSTERDEKNFDFNCIFYITMSKIQYKQLKDYIDIFEENSELCYTFEGKIKAIDKCMNEHSLYHNDLGKNNIFIDENNYDNIGIIDYGVATYKQFSAPDYNKKYECPTLLGNNQISPIGVADIDKLDLYHMSKGGKSKKRRNNKNKRKSRRNRRKSKKNQPK